MEVFRFQISVLVYLYRIESFNTFTTAIEFSRILTGIWSSGMILNKIEKRYLNA